METTQDFLPLAQRPRPSIATACALMLLAAAGLWLSSVIAGAFLPGYTQVFLADLVFYGFFVLLPVVLLCVRRPGLSDGLRLNPLPFAPTLMIALMAVMSVYAASALNGLWEMLLEGLGVPEPPLDVAVDSRQALMLSILHTAAIPAVCEELLCRGVVFAAFESRGTFRGLWVSSALFALLHSNLYGLPAYFMVGALSAFIVYAVDSIYAGMFFHTVYNTAILVIMHQFAHTDAAAQAEAMSGNELFLTLISDLAIVGISIALMVASLNLRRKTRGIEPVPRAPWRLNPREKAMLAALLLALAVSTAAITAMSGAMA